jgi:hypothetical protein
MGIYVSKFGNDMNHCLTILVNLLSKLHVPGPSGVNDSEHRSKSSIDHFECGFQIGGIGPHSTRMVTELVEMFPEVATHPVP